MNKNNFRTALILFAAAVSIVVPIPPDIATTVDDPGSERELVAVFVRANLIFNGQWQWWNPANPWFEFERALTKRKVRFRKGDTLSAVFVDGSTVQFAFIGKVLGCPSGMCFAWKDGTETGPLIKPKPDRRGMGEHPGKGRDDHFVFTGSDPLPSMAAPYDAFNPDNWAGPAPDLNAPRAGGGGRR